MNFAYRGWASILAFALLGCGSCTSDSARPNAAVGGSAGTAGAGGAPSTGGAAGSGAAGAGAAGSAAGGSSGGTAGMGGSGGGASGSAGAAGAGGNGAAGAGGGSTGGGGIGNDAGRDSGGAADSARGGSAGASDASRPGDGEASAPGNADASSGTPGIRVIGRTAPGTAGRVRFEWPGVSVVGRFSGTQVSIQLNDGGNRNEFEVIIDGNRQPKLVTAAGTTTYPLATGLAAGNHDVVVWRRTEASSNATELIGLTGFSAGGALLPAPPAPDRRIEVIGDSISAGYGIEGTDPCAAVPSNENNYLAYGSVAARALGADLYTEAWSGIGMYRNYNEATPVTPTMPQRYDYAIPTDTTTTWDYAKFQPHAVVINLGTNDYSTRGDPGQPYVDAYLAFLQRIRMHYPTAYIVCVIEWSTSDVRINQVVNAFKAAGDTRIESFDIRPVANSLGCSGHPNVAAGAAMGASLAAELRRVLGW